MKTSNSNFRSPKTFTHRYVNTHVTTYMQIIIYMPYTHKCMPKKKLGKAEVAVIETLDWGLVFSHTSIVRLALQGDLDLPEN